LEKPIVSIIIPVFNKCDYIKETINSVLNQDFNNFEVVVVDDGSSDDSLAVVNSIKDHRLQIFSQSNSGVERARNFGFSQSSGSFVVFLDADDLMRDSRLSKQLELFKTDEELVLVGTWANVIDHSGTITGSICPPTSNAAIQIGHLFRNQFVSSSVMVRRSAITDRLAFDETRGKRFAEDFDLWNRVLKKGLVANIPEKLTSYRRLAISRSQSSGGSLLESARGISAEWLYQNTHQFESISSAQAFVLSINGLDDLSPSSGCNLMNTLQTYDLVLSDLQLRDLGRDSGEFRKVRRNHKVHIVAWSLLGYVPLPIQRKVFSFFGSFKSLKFARWLLKTLANSNSQK
jgi:glycosyltransferase involved in cell wall biosynthesis